MHNEMMTYDTYILQANNDSKNKENGETRQAPCPPPPIHCVPPIVQIK